MGEESTVQSSQQMHCCCAETDKQVQGSGLEDQGQHHTFEGTQFMMKVAFHVSKERVPFSINDDVTTGCAFEK